ncbi:MAG: glycosyltransferase [Bryobacterales bacterium]|nr:glycosyltransferase [Bryobacterales bacterium]
MATLGRFAKALPLLLVSPVVIVISLLALLLTDLVWKVFGRRRLPVDSRPRNTSASVVIPNWNGRDLLEKYLPSVELALAGNPNNEVIVVDNGSTDGSAGYVRQHHPNVRLLALPKNLGFGGGSNAGFAEAKNDIVVLLNSDMRVREDFLAPLLEGFSDEKVFAVSCQIFFSDPNKVREETGLTQAWWENGGVRVRHRDDPNIQQLYPCFYGGGGSCAFDRRKFLELGGFDHLLKPFYLEDTDLGFLAWKRGWKVLYQPASVVYHEHRGTIGKTFTRAYIESIIHKNFLLFLWKNIHEPWRLISHFGFLLPAAMVSLLFGESMERTNLIAIAKAFLQLPGAMAARWRARSLGVVSDTEAFRRPMGGYFHDRFRTLPARPGRLRVLFISPYPICPPVHGGAVFMSQTCTELTRSTDLHLIVLVDEPKEIPPHKELADRCGSAHYLVRLEGQTRSFGSVLPHALHEYANGDLEWLIHRQIYLQQIDVVQYEYLPMAQYRGEYRQIAQFLFEHDLYFQSIGRQLDHMRGAVKRLAARYEYLRALRYELETIPLFDATQLCSSANRDFLLQFAPELAAKTAHRLRAGITASNYNFQPAGRTPNTMLFLGSFRHAPNTEALNWFVQQSLQHVLAECPDARLIVIGSDPPPRYSLPDFGDAIELRGYVDDIQAPLTECAVFVCPILSGSGVRVKLLESFASGIPVVSTRIGAEGLASKDGEICRLADDPREFARAILDLFANPGEAEAMARRARAEVERNWDMPVLTQALVKEYSRIVASKRRTS